MTLDELEDEDESEHAAENIGMCQRSTAVMLIMNE